jgi:hypothetical protein
MKITKKFLSLPPYVSVPWHNVGAIRLEPNSPTTPVLVVLLTDGSQVEIPNLSEAVIEAIFASHQSFLDSEEAEEELETRQSSTPFSSVGLADPFMGVPFRISAGGIEGISAAMAHSPEQAEAPDLPAEMLERVSGIARVLGIDNAVELPAAEAGCNCYHCQIARAITGTPAPNHAEFEEEEQVSDEELRFRSWDISESGEDLYLVVNPTEPLEKYSVCLRKPIGCTCGQSNCEHIRAVLNS